MYGIAISLGILVSALIGEKITRKENLNIELYWGAIIVAMIGGIIGARAYHVLDFYTYYITYPLEIFKMWHGGVGIYGGLIGGFTFLYGYLKRKNQNVVRWLTIFAIVLPLGQAIGRIGNIFNTELLPYAYYELLLDLILFTVLFYIYKFKNIDLKSNVYLGIYLLGYGLIRLISGTKRLDVWSWELLDVTHAVSTLFVLLGIILCMQYIFGKRK